MKIFDKIKPYFSFLSFLKNQKVKFGIAITIFILWVIWIGNFWLLLGSPIIFDIYISKKVRWAFWKKKNVAKQPKIIEWIDALIFAVVAATLIRMFFIEAFTIPTPSMEGTLLVGDYLFVSKASYGPKLPNTPLSFPFAHHTLPFTSYTKSYLEWVKWPYKRLAGLSEVKNLDIVVFNFPEGDTVCLDQQDASYYQLIREYDRDKVWETNTLTGKKPFGDIIVRPVDKKENYIKRCVGIAGDTLVIKYGHVYINGKLQPVFNTIQHYFIIETDGSKINPMILEKMDVNNIEPISSSLYRASLTYDNADKIRGFANVKSVKKYQDLPRYYDRNIFPHDVMCRWNADNFGPLWIPKKGATIKLTKKNLVLYSRVIQHYENNKLKVDGEKVYINDQLTDSYTFKMNYFWLMGDNRHRSADSRYWGFVPDDHVVGKAVFVWLSLDPTKSLFSKIRFSRMFRFIHD